MIYCTVKSKMTTSTIETSMFPYTMKCTSSIRLKWNVWSGAFSACIKPTHMIMIHVSMYDLWVQVIHGSSSLIPVSGVQLTPCTESLCLSCYIFLLHGFWDLDSCLQISRGYLWHSSFTNLKDFPQCWVSGVLVLVSLLNAFPFLFLLPEQQFRFLLKGTESQVFNERMYYLFKINIKYKF